MSALGLIAHSTMDEPSIAASTMISWRMGLIVAVGIIVHDISVVRPLASPTFLESCSEYLPCGLVAGKSLTLLAIVVENPFRPNNGRECNPHRVIRASLYTACAIRAITR